MRGRTEPPVSPPGVTTGLTQPEVVSGAFTSRAPSAWPTAACRSGSVSGLFLGLGSVDLGKSSGFGAHLLKQAVLWPSRLFPSCPHTTETACFNPAGGEGEESASQGGSAIPVLILCDLLSLSHAPHPNRHNQSTQTCLE